MRSSTPTARLLLPLRFTRQTTIRRFNYSSLVKRVRPVAIFQSLRFNSISLATQDSRSMTTQPDSKRVKMSGDPKPMRIGTHNGHFHADEALAVYLLRLMPQYASASLVRTRDPELLATCDVVVDVGGTHNHEQFRYDHHQREFNATFPGKATKLSSAGLVWMHHGKAIIHYCTGLPLDSPDTSLLYQKIYDDFIEAFDANDNGISNYDASALSKAGFDKKFLDKGFSIASVVARYNSAPSTKTPENGYGAIKEKTQEEEDARFLRASAFVGEQFHLELTDRFQSWLPARALIEKAFASRTQYDSAGRILVVPQTPDGGAPWADHLYSLEREHGVEGQVLYALFAENGEPGCKWRIRAVSVAADSFENRKGLPEQWRGVRDQDLSGVAGIEGCIFVHASGFIGGNQTFDGALEMAKKAVEA